MKQLTQKLKDGQLRILEVPTPVLGPGQVLIRAHYSVISAGTEGSTVSTARKSLIGKAKERPQQAKQVLDALTQQGPVQTYRAVMKKLDSHSPLGYSAAGEVIDVAPDVRGFAPGDKVACGGVGYANHAEVLAVPVNLVVKLTPDADLEAAAYNTVGAIALQGIRQADLRLGETCVVIGLGLLGQLTGVLLRAAGVRVLGVDLDPVVVDVARAHSADEAFTTDEPGLEARIEEFTGGVGADAVIITAATASTEPINLAGRVLRKRGRVVIVGNVPTGFDRGPYYDKELELRMSCSYGPGRYDIRYEEQGIDYPVGYVRWTENRNMQAYQQLVADGRADLGFLTTHRFALDEAPGAYDLILQKEEPALGIVIAYDTGARAEASRLVVRTGGSWGAGTLGFIGAGSYAMSHLLPNVKPYGGRLKGVMTARGTSSRSVAERYGFEYCTSDAAQILGDRDIDTVFVATRHDSHARYALEALEAGKHVFVEKPLALTPEELAQVTEVVARLEEEGRGRLVMTGFNRRFSPLTTELIERVGQGPMTMIYRVNAGYMPSDHWMQIADIGGGRIIGEGCHFIDYLTHLNGSPPVEVFASAMDDPQALEDNILINLRFENGSIGTVAYFANGPKSLPKEYVEVYRAGVCARIHDFRKLEIHGGAKTHTRKLMAQDKGQPEMMRQFLEAVRQGTDSPIPFDQIHAVLTATFRAVESFRTKRPFTL